MTLPADPFGRSRLPTSLGDREQRLLWADEASKALLEGRAADPQAAAYVGSAIQSWLEDGRRVGDLERRFLRTVQPRRSHKSVADVWRAIKARLDI